MVTTRSWWCLICSCVFWSSKEGKGGANLDWKTRVFSQPLEVGGGPLEKFGGLSLAESGGSVCPSSCIKRCARLLPSIANGRERVHAIIQEPQNIRLNSVMLNSVLLWDPSNFSEGNVTYTIQYKSMKSNFTDLCRRIYFTECNISNIPKYGLSNLRIRAEFENKQSHWIYLNFTPFMDTIIIPPIVQIIPTKPGVLDVYLQSPPVILSGIRYSLKDFYGSIGYKMKIWMNTSEQVNNVTTPHPFHVISGLNPGITYCLKAQVFIEEYNKTGEWSEATCTQTINSNYIIGTDSVIELVIFLTVLAFIFFCCIIYFRIKRCFYPSYSLPQHFIQFLSHPYDSSQFLDSQSQGEDHNYDTVIVLSEKSKQCNSESENKTSNIKQELQGSQEDIIRPK